MSDRGRGRDGQPGAPGAPGATGRDGLEGERGARGERGPEGQRYLTVRKASAFFVVACLLLGVLAWAIAQNASDVASKNASAQVERDSVARQVAACNRGNARVNAYLLLRAEEFVKTDQLKESYTTIIAPQVQAILDCDGTVRDAKYRPVEPAVEKEYLHWYKLGYVATLKDGKIVGKVPFDVYFGQP